MNITNDEAILYLTKLKNNPIKYINEIDSEIEMVTFELIMDMAIDALRTNHPTNP